MPPSTASQPGQREVQALLRAYGGRQMADAEQRARAMAKLHPGAVVAHSILASILVQRGDAAAALPHGEAAARLQPRTAELQFNLALILTALGRWSDAVSVYQRGLALKPDAETAHFNLGSALQMLGNLDGAGEHFDRATRLNPAYAEAWGNLGGVRQSQGRLDAAVAAYQHALALPQVAGATRARLLCSLASVQRNLGHLPAAICLLQQAVDAAPGLAEAHDRLGWALWAQGDAAGAKAGFAAALALDPALASAHYHLGVVLQDSGERRAAVIHFRQAQLDDSADRALYCLYREGDFVTFRQDLAERLEQPDAHRSALLATLTAHHAHNFTTDNPHQFCPQPLDFVHRQALPALAPGSPLLAEVLATIAGSALAHRQQGRLHHGVQSAGNLFRRPEACLQTVADLVLEAVRTYPLAFPTADCLLIRQFPANPAFSSSWYIRMRQGGHLTSHIHEEGWISGCLYLAMPDTPAGQLDGSIAFSTHGDQHPCVRDDFPEMILTPAVGDLVLFPSSLFHRTVPYTADQERICIAFDILPARTEPAHGG